MPINIAMPIRTFTRKCLEALRRRPAVSGPSRSDRDTLGKRLKRRESWGEIFGITVGVGLIIEYWDDIHDCFVHWHAPPMPLIGGLLVTIGVLGEVFFSRLVVSTSEELQALADSDVSQANRKAAEALERAANAERDAAEANLARVKLEQRMSPRTLFGPGHEELKTVLASRADTTVDIVLFDHHVQETVLFAAQLISVFSEASWKTRLWKSRRAVTRIAGPPTLVITALNHASEFSSFTLDLTRVLTSLRIECAHVFGGFGLEQKAEFEPGDFELAHEYPMRFMSLRKLSPFRIQVGQLQLVSLPPANVTRVVSGNANPSK
jgi:hypothetical protein